MAHPDPSASSHAGVRVPGSSAANDGKQIQDANPPPKFRDDGIKMLEVFCVNAGLISFRSMSTSLRITSEEFAIR